jgi:hypothetical protein
VYQARPFGNAWYAAGGYVEFLGLLEKLGLLKTISVTHDSEESGE